MATEDRGFASMDRKRQRDIASKGGKAAHKKGVAHEWTHEEAVAAGRKGGLRRQAQFVEQRRQKREHDQQAANAAGEGMVTGHD